MDSDNTTASYYRKSRLVVSHGGTEELREINRNIDNLTDITSAKNPSAILPPEVTGMVSVYDMETKSFHLLLMHCLNHQPWMARDASKVVVFSEPQYAVSCTENLQLATPAYYRDKEELKPGIHDRYDGSLTKDGIGWAQHTIGAAGAVTKAEFSFISLREPWVYCASHYRDGRDLHRLRCHFADNYDYTAATRIQDPDAFAMWLGIDFALTLDKTVHVKLNMLDVFSYERSQYHTNLWDGSRPIDTVLHICYGPVCYEDQSGRIDTQEQFFDPTAGPKAWFTKRKSYTMQSEYRFAVSTLGDPVRPKHYIAVSPELRGLTSVL